MGSLGAERPNRGRMPDEERGQDEDLRASTCRSLLFWHWLLWTLLAFHFNILLDFLGMKDKRCLFFFSRFLLYHIFFSFPLLLFLRNDSISFHHERGGRFYLVTTCRCSNFSIFTAFFSDPFLPFILLLQHRIIFFLFFRRTLVAAAAEWGVRNHRRHSRVLLESRYVMTLVSFFILYFYRRPKRDFLEKVVQTWWSPKIGLTANIRLGADGKTPSIYTEIWVSGRSAINHAPGTATTFGSSFSGPKWMGFNHPVMYVCARILRAGQQRIKNSSPKTGNGKPDGFKYSRPTPLYLPRFYSLSPSVCVLLSVSRPV